MGRKRKTLPKDFEALLETGDLQALKAVFDRCEIEASADFSGGTALAIAACPSELTVWLLQQEADIEAEDRYGVTPLQSRSANWRGRIDELLAMGANPNHGEGSSRGTPLHSAAGSGMVENVRRLLDAGARVDALNDRQQTPLDQALERTSNARLVEMAAVARCLVEAGAAVTTASRDYVRRIGKTFEFHRAGFDPEAVEAASDALDDLYRLVDVPPRPRRILHDGRSPVVAPGGDWREAYHRLWDMLVPSEGAAGTVQGEVIRIPGRLAREIHGNGGANWNADFRAMGQAWLGYLRAGMPPGAQERQEAASIVRDLDQGGGDTDRLRALAIAWVASNPTPIPLTPPKYRL